MNISKAAGAGWHARCNTYGKRQTRLDLKLPSQHFWRTDMNLATNDIAVSASLDRQALAAIKGGSDWHLRSSFVSTGSWSGYTQMFSSYVGQTRHCRVC